MTTTTGEVTAGASLLTFFSPLSPPTLTAVTPDLVDVAHLPRSPSGEIAPPSGEIAPPSGEIASPSDEIASPVLHLAVGNVAPTGTMVCMLSPANISADSDPSSDPPSANSALDSPINSPASFVSSTSATCHAPRVPALGTYRLRVSIDGGRTYSATWTEVTYYNSTIPTRVTGVHPRYAPLPAAAAGDGAAVDAGSRPILSVFGAGFAPTAELACAFGHLGDSANIADEFADGCAVDAPVPPGTVVRGQAIKPSLTRASFVTTGVVRCAAPAPLSRAAEIFEVLVVRESTGGDSTRVGGAVTVFEWYDPSAISSAKCAEPDAAPLRGATLIAVGGSDFAPAPGLMCVFSSTDGDAGEYRG